MIQIHEMKHETKHEKKQAMAVAPESLEDGALPSSLKYKEHREMLLSYLSKLQQKPPQLLFTSLGCIVGHIF